MIEGRTIDAEAMESRTAIVEKPKDRRLSHRGLFAGLENLIGFAFLCFRPEIPLRLLSALFQNENASSWTCPIIVFWNTLYSKIVFWKQMTCFLVSWVCGQGTEDT